MLPAISTGVDAVQFWKQDNALLLVWISARDHGDYRVGRTGVIWQMGNVRGYIEKVARPNNRMVFQTLAVPDPRLTSQGVNRCFMGGVLVRMSSPPGWDGY